MSVPVLTVDVGTRGTDTVATTAAVTWLNVDDDLELQDLVNIGFSRQNDVSQADPNTCTLTFEATEFKTDADGAYATLEPSGVEIAVGVPLRVQAEPSGTAVRNRFQGFISSITPVWPSGNLDNGLRVQVRADSRLAWVARARDLQDRTSAALAALGATSYWPMTEAIKEPDGTAYSSPPWHEFDNQPKIWVRSKGDDRGTSGAFGRAPEEWWGPSPDGLKVASFKAAQYGVFNLPRLAAQVAAMPQIAPTAAWSVTMMARLGRVERTEKALFKVFQLRGCGDFGFHAFGSSIQVVDWDGDISFFWDNSGANPLWRVSALKPGGTANITETSSAPEIRDREWHLFTLTSTGGAKPTLRIYFDDDLIRTLSMRNGGFALNSISVGEYAYLPHDDKPVDIRHEFGRLAIFDGIRLTDGQVATLYEDVINQSGEGDTVTERLQRWVNYGGFTNSQLTVTDAGGTPLLPQAPTGSPLALMQAVAETDGGVLFDRRNGNMGYRGPNVRTTASSSVLNLDATTSEPGNMAVSVDTAGVVNQVTIKAADESATVVRTDEASIALHGYAGEEHTLVTASKPHLTNRADWLLYKNSTPRPRVPVLTVEVATLSAAKQSQILAENLDPGSLVAVTGLPAAISGVPSLFFVEGATETWGVGTCEVSLYVTDATTELTASVLDDATRGVLNSSYVIG